MLSPPLLWDVKMQKRDHGPWSQTMDSSPKSLPSYMTEVLTLQLPHFLICEKGFTIPAHLSRWLGVPRAKHVTMLLYTVKHYVNIKHHYSHS